MIFKMQAGAEWRALVGAALIGSGLGLAVGATYLAAGAAATDPVRPAPVVQAAVAAPPAPVGTPAVAAAPVPGVAKVSAAARLAHKPDRGGALNCLTQAVYFEARGESARGQAAVAQVVLNRVKHPAFPNTVCGVVFQGASRHRCQFSFACDGAMHHRLDRGAWNRARKVAARALSGFVLADVGKATHFHTTGVAPAWGSRMLRVSQVGLHVFYRFNPHPHRAAPAPQHAVFVSLPAQAMAPTAPLRIAVAMVDKTIDSTLVKPGLVKPGAPGSQAPAQDVSGAKTAGAQGAQVAIAQGPDAKAALQAARPVKALAVEATPPAVVRTSGVAAAQDPAGAPAES